MSRVRVYLGCSLDGHIAGPEHNLDFLSEFTPDLHAPAGGLGFTAFLDAIGVLLMGRRTYQVLLDHDAWWYGDRTVLVATHHPLPPAPGGGHAVAVSGPIQAMIAQAKGAAKGKDVYLDGGDLVRQGFEAGVVDTFCLTVLPLVLGRGIRLWEGLDGRTDVKFDPPVAYGGSMIQISGHVVKR